MMKIGFLIYFGGTLILYSSISGFRDVLVFDTTNKTIAYGKPLVLFAGANNHSATCVFGAALLLDETFTSYKWALTKLMDSMGSKHPLSIPTDGDEAMRQAIDEVFPNC
jgi:hypothetical protein